MMRKRSSPKGCLFVGVYFFFSLWDKALPAILFVLALERPSFRALDAFVATAFEVTFLAISVFFKLNYNNIERIKHWHECSLPN